MLNLFMHQISNGRYQVKVTPAGGGQSMWDWIALSRWVEDPVEDARGFFICLRDLEHPHAAWSAGLQPVASAPESYRAAGGEGRFETERTDHGISARMQVAVSKEDDVEVRRLTLRNLTGQPRRIELTSCIEVALAHPMGDLGHPAFSKLFVQTEWLAADRVLVARRRPRSQGETWPAMFHALLDAAPSEWETDRLRFIGRGRSLASPAALAQASGLSGTVGNVLDPLFSLRTVMELAPGEAKSVAFLLGAAADHSTIAAVVKRHREPAALEAMFKEMALTSMDVPPVVPCRPAMAEGVAAAADEALAFFNGIGGFSDDGSEYVMRLRWQGGGFALPPMPWINVLANEQFGCLVSETGAGCTWGRNSQANRLTPWSNDPVIDPHDEALFIRDEESGVFWSPLPGPAPAPADYEVRHGFGYSRFITTAGGLHQETTVFVARHDPVKVVRLRIVNQGASPRRLSLYAYQRLVLGSLPPAPGTIRTWAEDGLLCAENTKAGDFAGATVFALAVLDGAPLIAQHVSCDRGAFLGQQGSAGAPLALSQATLDGRSEGDDPCFARQLVITLPAGQALECSFVLGEAMGAGHLKELVARWSETPAIASGLEEVTTFWRETLGGVQARTPSPEIDLMVNGWLAYQALACRIWGRTAFYQSSGAFGFRDQLQDTGNLCLLLPELTRHQILLHARHQFEEGDVLHWWHDAPVERGIRTLFSDDLLWLPFVVCNYLHATGDAALLDETAGFLHAPVLAPGQEENYLKPETSQQTASVYDHCCRSLDRSLTAGAHGLPLMGTGDWNDGMSRVGREGKGESVWLGFFLFQILGDFIPLAKSRGEAERVDRYAAFRTKLQAALNDTGWDGEWYRRAYYDDGTPLGTHSASECRIDGLAQSWSVLSGAAPAQRAAQAMGEAEKQLINEDQGLIRLLTPPFVSTAEDPGYIKGYVAGVRENGGQYTHAACWMVAAMARLGRRDRAARLLAMLSPLHHTSGEEGLQRYKVEPYVIAADVYGADPHIGRGGWTWYTGSAGWAWRVAVESVLGLSIADGKVLVLKPCVPDQWPGFELSYRHPASGTRYHFQIANPDRCSEAVVAVSADDLACEVTDAAAHIVMKCDGGIHEVKVTLGRHPSP